MTKLQDEEKTLGDTEIEILDQLEKQFEDDIGDHCEFGDCLNEVTHEILCGDCLQSNLKTGSEVTGRERICAEHAQEFVLLKDKVVVPLRFDHTCGHETYLHKCEIIPV